MSAPVRLDVPTLKLDASAHVGTLLSLAAKTPKTRVLRKKPYPPKIPSFSVSYPSKTATRYAVFSAQACTWSLYPIGYVDGMGLYVGYFAMWMGMDPSGLGIWDTITEGCKLLRDAIIPPGVSEAKTLCDPCAAVDTMIIIAQRNILKEELEDNPDQAKIARLKQQIVKLQRVRSDIEKKENKKCEEGGKGGGGDKGGKDAPRSVTKARPGHLALFNFKADPRYRVSDEPTYTIFPVIPFPSCEDLDQCCDR